ncbi:MAG TPA: DUF3089 domain-containing protein [Hellea balneolensis]|uniref:DUF3089 domain-containing protein n=1 Tax=Hellea balneolensis TaxID=287478 RepID=A0A7C3GAQ3_9PROT|nr:DUF3089 domain-containing protein [Hellea balneolensis]
MPKLSPKLDFSAIQLKFIAIGFAILWALLLIGTSWYYRDDLYQTIHDPRVPFQTHMSPPAPDYALVGSWLHRPTRADSENHSESDGGGDVFIVTPTVYEGRRHWNADVSREKIREKFIRIALPNYVLPYQSAGRVFAPYYRQASLYTFLTNREDAQEAQRFAYQDVKRAFEVFLKSNPPERPIVLVGHGQGGLHVTRLLMEYFTGDLSQKLAAAYIIDHPLPLEVFDHELSTLHPCESKADTNCVVSFGAFEPKEKTRARRYVGRKLVWDKDELRSVGGRSLLCTNPLSWSRATDYIPARLHLGGVAAEGLERDTAPAPSPMQTGAQCQDGILHLDKPRHKSLRRPSRFGGNYRTLPFNIFYEDLRVDSARRVQNLIDKNILPRLAPLIEDEVVEIKDSPITLPLKPIKQ